MAGRDRVKVGIIGSRFEADIHAESFRIMPDEAEVVAVASPTPGNAKRLAEKYGIPRVFTDYREMPAGRRYRDGDDYGAERLACADDGGYRECGETRGVREAVVYDVGGGGLDDRHLPAEGRVVAVRGGAVFPRPNT